MKPQNLKPKVYGLAPRDGMVSDSYFLIFFVLLGASVLKWIQMGWGAPIVTWSLFLFLLLAIGITSAFNRLLSYRYGLLCNGPQLSFYAMPMLLIWAIRATMFILILGYLIAFWAAFPMTSLNIRAHKIILGIAAILLVVYCVLLVTSKLFSDGLGLKRRGKNSLFLQAEDIKTIYNFSGCSFFFIVHNDVARPLVFSAKASEKLKIFLGENGYDTKTRDINSLADLSIQMKPEYFISKFLWPQPWNLSGELLTIDLEVLERLNAMASPSEQFRLDEDFSRFVNS